MDYKKDLEEIREIPEIALDTETTGLRPYHGDKPFCITMAHASKTYYFEIEKLTLYEKALLAEIFFDKNRLWYLHNAKFDMHMLATLGWELAGTVHCTKVGARLEYNDHMSYSLAACAERIGFKKDDTVEKYIQENKLFTVVEIPGKGRREKIKHFDKVDRAILSEYARKDADITFNLAKRQEENLKRLSDDLPPPLPSLHNILSLERSLTKVVYQMEKTGLRIDRDYCMRAALHETAQAEKASTEFTKLTNKPFLSSPKLFSEIFESDKSNWLYTDKGNPSFDSEALKKFSNPAARCILDYRNAKSRSDFYNGFLYHADSNGDVHPSFDQSGTSTGRFSSSNPNFQNLTKEDETSEFQVRNCIVPREGYYFVSLDYLAAEYRMMLELAGKLVVRESSLINMVKSGMDVHQATADLVKLQTGKVITRSQAKTVNFATLYGSGNAKLAENLKVSLEEAKLLKDSIFSAAPEIKQFIRTVTKTAESRGWIFNWMGRRSYYPDPNTTYRATNHLVQGSCADVMKKAMVDVFDFLKDYKTRMILQVHDELLFEVHHTEKDIVPTIQNIMECAFPYTRLQQICDKAEGDKSFGELG